MKPSLSREVCNHIKSVVNRRRQAYLHVPFNAHDWDDIAQTIMIHVCRKWRMWKGDTWKKWVNVIVQNQLKNQFRDRILDFNNKGPHQPLYTKVQDGDVIVYERDIEEGGPDQLTLIYRAISLLPPSDRKLFDKMLKHGKWERARGRMKPSRFQTYRRKQCAIVRELIESS